MSIAISSKRVRPLTKKSNKLLHYEIIQQAEK